MKKKIRVIQKPPKRGNLSVKQVREAVKAVMDNKKIKKCDHLFSASVIIFDKDHREEAKQLCIKCNTYFPYKMENPLEAPIKHDPVNHPKHYNSSPAQCECGRTIECIDITRHMGFNLGNAVKYIWRYADKNGLEDLKKAAWYLNDFINRENK